MEKVRKSGYLNSEYKLFYLTDNTPGEFEYHYHDFHKLLIFMEGDVTYSVEGRDYNLQPGDIILINAGEIHRPRIRSQIPYRRMIAYISPEFCASCQENGFSMDYCFEQAKKMKSNLIQLPENVAHRLQVIVKDLVDTFEKEMFCGNLYQKMKLMEYLILLNQSILEETGVYLQARTANPMIREILDYINEHITEELSVDRIAEHMYMNRSYLMHLFKKETGYTIGKYITEKRLFLSNHLISQGLTITEACYKSGFQNYSTFFQAYRNKYHVSPNKGRVQIDIFSHKEGIL